MLLVGGDSSARSLKLTRLADAAGGRDCGITMGGKMAAGVSSVIDKFLLSAPCKALCCMTRSHTVRSIICVVSLKGHLSVGCNGFGCLLKQRLHDIQVGVDSETNWQPS